MQTTPRPSPDVVSQELDGEVVLVHLQTNRIYALNATAARFWQHLGAGLTLEEIRAALAREFDVDPHQLQQEIESLVADLATEGLILNGAR